MPDWLIRVWSRLLYGPPRRVPPPPGTIARPDLVPTAIDLVYDVARTKLTEQLASIEQLDTKAGVLVGALVAATGVFLATGHLVLWARVTFASILVLSIAIALIAFVVRQYEDAPDPETFVGYAMLEGAEAKTLTLRDVLRAWRLNERKVVLKGRLINFSLMVAGIGVVIALIARAALRRHDVCW